MIRSNSCPRCQGTMTEGFVLDERHGSRAISTWVEGLPKKSFWMGVNISGKAKHEIQTWRCGRCGFLESYAKG